MPPGRELACQPGICDAGQPDDHANIAGNEGDGGIAPGRLADRKREGDAIDTIFYRIRTSCQQSQPTTKPFDGAVWFGYGELMSTVNKGRHGCGKAQRRQKELCNRVVRKVAHGQ